jgi:hypothetical protein
MIQKNMFLPYIFILVWFSLALGGATENVNTKSYKTFSDYWYQGKAELNRFALQQVRYGEMREGDAVLVFVTEDFLPDKQVKYEYKPADEQPVSTLKLNFTRKFLTGIYPYSIMSSVFTPIDASNGKTLKVTTSVQEWCGHTFMQLNYRNGQYSSQLRSYFQAESDQDVKIGNVWLEDALWTQIRIDPQNLPKGDFEVLPGTQYLRLSHKKSVPQEAVAILEVETSNSKKQFVYTLRYKNIPRELSIRFDTEFPFQIQSWEESNGDGELKTTAIRTNTLLLDYWTKNGNQDVVYREELGL